MSSQAGPGSSIPPDVLRRARDPLALREAFDERAGIYEFCAGLPRLEAELRALRDLQHMLEPKRG